VERFEVRAACCAARFSSRWRSPARFPSSGASMRVAGGAFFFGA
jgi:hypothetical protein